ncbi:MAG: hypothetical protein Q9195_009274 [Heterodermia aff. obscurata]
MLPNINSPDTEMNSTGRPWTFRVENIPPDTTAEDLKKRFYTEDQPYIQVRSLVPAVDNDEKDIQEYTATVLFQNPDPAVLSPRLLDDDDITIDSDFHGFTPLTNPTEPIAADIIAVTGLAAHAFGSWAHSARNMWLRDYLPRDIKNARVMVLCDINGSINIYSSRLPVRSIIFLGAPHKGLEIRALETLVKTQPGEDIVRELKAESPTLTELNDKFRYVAENIDILTCYEMIPTKTAMQMEDGSWKKEGPPEMMVSLDSARQWYPREKLVACNADHTQIAKLKRGENSIYPSVKFAIKQAMLSASDLYSEVKSKQNEMIQLRASDDVHPSDVKLRGSYLAESSPREPLVSSASDQSRDVIETNQRSFSFKTKYNVHGEQEARRQSQPLHTAVLGWQRNVEEHSKASPLSPPSFADQTETETKSEPNEKHFSRSQSQDSNTSFGLGIDEPSMSSIHETLSAGPRGAGSTKEQLPPENLTGANVNDSARSVPDPQGVSNHDTSKSGLGAKVPSMSSAGPVLVSQGESDHHDVSKNVPSAKLMSGQEQSNDKSKISADQVIPIEDDELTKAIKEGNEEKTRGLLNLNYAINRRSQSDHGATPLITATKYRQQNLVKFLLEQGASATARDNDGNTTLHVLASATDSGQDKIDGPANENILELLLKSQPPLEILNNDGHTPLMQAVRFGQEYLAERLILSGANVTTSDSDGWTALHYAAFHAHCPDLISILAEAGAAVNATSTKSMTPLHIAGGSVRNSAQVTERLIAAGADTEALDLLSQTPLHIATIGNNSACVAQLLKLGANVRAKSKKDRETPLHIAARECKSSTDIVEHLLQAGANIEAEASYGKTPLHRAVMSDNMICVIHLLERDANIHAIDNGLWTPLHWAAERDSHPMVKLLLERGANPCAKDLSMFGGRPSGRAYNRDVKYTLKKAEKAWKTSGNK